MRGKTPKPGMELRLSEQPDSSRFVEYVENSASTIAHPATLFLIPQPHLMPSSTVFLQRKVAKTQSRKGISFMSLQVSVFAPLRLCVKEELFTFKLFHL